MQQIYSTIAHNLSIQINQVETVLKLVADGATVPFIARYRKDVTKGLDEVQVQQIIETNQQLQEFYARKATIEKSITEQGKMTEELQKALNEASTLTALEDIYLPYKPKRKTKAQAAREQGLAPLAEAILAFEITNLEQQATAYLNDVVTTTEAVLQGAKEIVIETISEHAELRTQLRALFEKEAVLQSTVMEEKEAEAAKYKDYFAFSERIASVPSHRILAILRGFLEGFLRISIHPAEEEALYLIEQKFVQPLQPATEFVKKACTDSYRRFLQPSLETDFRNQLKLRADEDAIAVFSENLKQLLLSAPLGGKRLLAIDPGYRTGCKTVCLSQTGDLLTHDVIFIHDGVRLPQAEATVRGMVKQYALEAVAVGDGTAGRETEQFIKKLNLGIPIFLVNEDGASVYSASEVARQEFPDHDVTVRGAVSIGRRLIDPLAELVKIDPKSIGVGQYQHDVNQVRLKEKLDQSVESCVNNVGVNLNTASKQLLSYVSGLGASTAENIVQYRKKIGAFASRKQLLEVPRLGAKAFEQCAGFVRIPNGTTPLDASAVHPEHYPIVEQMAADVKLPVAELIGNSKALASIQPKAYCTAEIGMLTIQDILNELKKPGLDPRPELELFEYANVYKLEDLSVGLVVPGVVTNITRFGAFVDVGVKQDGLVHVSEISHKYISDPAEALTLNQKVQVKVLEVDIARKRISLSIKQATEMPAKAAREAKKPAQLKAAPTESFTDSLASLQSKFKKR
ncbi:MAG: RNA-binding transcriptional accessory protein [Bacteroidetes bacterium]|nr:MAG: RNA-binding transcriptional accessory protein [Bacteroidota bacterium]